MNTALIVIGVVCAFGIFANLLMQMKKPQGVLPQADLDKDITRLEKELSTAKQELAENSGKSKRLFIELEQAKAKLDAIEGERDTLKSTVTKFETKREQNEKEHRQLVDKMEAAEKSWQRAEQRVNQEEQERLKEIEENRNRIWKEHENKIIGYLIELCSNPKSQFAFLTNDSPDLPTSFKGKKPDFAIQFLGQYIIFDPKYSTAENIQTYVNNQVKVTAEKYKNNKDIYPHIFLVIPAENIAELKTLIYPKNEFYFYVVYRDALAPILALLKRITEYANFEEMEPQKRENIINFMAEMSTQINVTSATSLIAAKRGVEVLARIQETDLELAKEIEQKSKEKISTAYSQTEIKRLASSITAQNSEITALASPKAPISKKMIQAAESVIAQKLL